MKKSYIALFPLGIVLIWTIGLSAFATVPSNPPPWGVTWGAFSNYFKNIIENNNCSGDAVITGFKVNPLADYGTPICTSVSSLVGTTGTGSDLPIGAVVAFNTASCPSGWSPANGTSGTPDLRGEFIRGLDSGRGVDGGRTLASWQADLFKAHNHNYDLVISGVYAGNGTIVAPVINTVSNSTSTTGGNETRPRNVALLYCVKTSASSSSGSGSTGGGISYWFSNDSGNNIFFTGSSNVGIGTSSPTAKLEVVGGDAKINSVTVGRGGGSNVTNTVVGSSAMSANVTGNQNVALGTYALNGNSVGSNNVAVGNMAGSNLTTGSNNIFIGNNVQPTSTSVSNTLNIGNWIYVSGGNVGIWTSTPSAKLDIAGSVKIVDGTQWADKVLTSNASGNASWKDFWTSVWLAFASATITTYTLNFPNGGWSNSSPTAITSCDLSGWTCRQTTTLTHDYCALTTVAWNAPHVYLYKSGTAYILKVMTTVSPVVGSSHGVATCYNF